MTLGVLELSDRLWRGELRVEDVHPFSLVGPVEELADGVGFVPSFANVSALRTEDGLVLVDTGSAPLAQHVHGTLRSWDSSRLHTAVYSHGHIDHVFGVPVFAAEAQERGWSPPQVVAHEALPARFDRYVLTAGYNEIVNQRQFSMPDLRWPRDYRYPDVTYRDALALQVGGLDLQLTHWRSGRSRWRTQGTCAWPGTWPSWRGRRRRERTGAGGAGRRLRPPGAERGLHHGEGRVPVDGGAGDVSSGPRRGRGRP